MGSADDVPLLRLSGTPEAMGHEHGETLRAAIRELADERIDLIELAVDRRGARNMIQSAAETILNSTHRLVPDVYREVASTASAAGIPLWMLVVAGGFSDVIDFVAGAGGPPECTLWGRQDPGRQRIVGTWDSHATAAAALVVVHRTPARGVETLALSTAGWPMQQGVTSDGLAFAIANLVGSARPTRGISYICALPQIVQAPSANSACETACELPLISGRYFIFADSKGGGRSMESDGVQCWISGKAAPHTNHFIFAGQDDVEGRPWMIEASDLRLRAAERLSESDSTFVAALPDVFPAGGESRLIIQSGKGREDRTCAAFVLDPSERSIRFWAGDVLSTHGRTLRIEHG